jgi:aminopeptidase N
LEALLILLFLNKKRMKSSARLYLVILFIFKVWMNSDQLFSQTARNQLNYDVIFYGLDLEMSDTSTYIQGFTQINIKLLENNDSLFFNLGSQLLVSKVTINTQEVEFKHYNDSLFLLANSPVVGEILQIIVYYEGDGSDALHDGAIFNKSTDFGQCTYSLTEPFASRYWFPCKEILEDKADSVHVYVTVPTGQRVGSNGLLIDEEQVNAGHTKFKWQSVYPVSFYLISVAIADYREYTIYADINDTIHMPVVNYIYNSDEYFSENKADIDTTVDLLKVFSDAFGIYPFYKEKYGHSLAPIGGGMEHQTMTTLLDFRFLLVAHELTHQWFGDKVTCKYWNDIWVNEGFASYGEYVALERLDSKIAAGDWMNSAQDIVLSEPGGSVYVSDEQVGDANRIFDNRTTYKKGAAIIHMIRYELNNDDLFFSILQEYLRRFSFKTATGDDFKEVLEEMSGISFDNFFEEWYYGEGYPKMAVSWFQMNDTLYISNRQTTSSPNVTDFFHVKVQYKLIFPGADSIIEFRQNLPDEMFTIYMPSPVYDIVVDPENYLLKKIISCYAADTGDIFLHPVLFYPNPVTDKLSLFSPTLTQPVDLYFYNISGIQVKSFNQVYPYNATLNVEDLDTGVYFIQLQAGSTSDIFKIIKN